MVNGTSSLDVNAIVTKLMQVEQRPLQVLAQRESVFTTRMAAIARVQGAVSTLQSAAAALAKSATFTATSANVTGDGVGAAVTGTAVAAGRYTVEVGNLAQAQSLASARFAASSTVVGTGTLTIQKGTATPVNIVINAGSNTLAGVRDAINAANAGLSAALVSDGVGTVLTLTAKDTGAANAFKVTVTDDDGNPTDAAGLSQLVYNPTALPAPVTNLTQKVAAEDAALKVNGLDITAASNTVTGAIDGVTLTLKKEAVGVNNEVVVSLNTGGMRIALDAFVKAYNDLDKTVREVTAYEPTTRKAGALNGDFGVRSLQAQARALASGAMNAAGGDYTRLSDVGIEMQKDGSLSLNNTKLDAALADPAKLARLFTTPNAASENARGFGMRFEALAAQLVGTDGLLPARTKGLQSQIDALSKQEVRINARLAQTEARLRKQYAALDVQLQQMQGTSDSLANALRQLPGARGG